MAKNGTSTANGKTSAVVWFNRSLPFLEQNKGLSIAKRKANAEKDARKRFKESGNEVKWKFIDFEWTPPKEDGGRFKLKMNIRRKRGHTGPPNDPPIKSGSFPPPSM